MSDTAAIAASIVEAARAASPTKAGTGVVKKKKPPAPIITIGQYKFDLGGFTLSGVQTTLENVIKILADVVPKVEGGAIVTIGGAGLGGEVASTSFISSPTATGGYVGAGGDPSVLAAMQSDLDKSNAELEDMRRRMEFLEKEVDRIANEPIPEPVTIDVGRFATPDQIQSTNSRIDILVSKFAFLEEREKDAQEDSFKKVEKMQDDMDEALEKVDRLVSNNLDKFEEMEKRINENSLALQQAKKSFEHHAQFWSSSKFDDIQAKIAGLEVDVSGLIQAVSVLEKYTQSENERKNESNAAGSESESATGGGGGGGATPTVASASSSSQTKQQQQLPTLFPSAANGEKTSTAPRSIVTKVGPAVVGSSAKNGNNNAAAPNARNGNNGTSAAANSLTAREQQQKQLISLVSDFVASLQNRSLDVTKLQEAEETRKTKDASYSIAIADLDSKVTEVSDRLQAMPLRGGAGGGGARSGATNVHNTTVISIHPEEMRDMKQMLNLCESRIEVLESQIERGITGKVDREEVEKMLQDVSLSLDDQVAILGASSELKGSLEKLDAFFSSKADRREMTELRRAVEQLAREVAVRPSSSGSISASSAMWFGPSSQIHSSVVVSKLTPNDRCMACGQSCPPESEFEDGNAISGPNASGNWVASSGTSTSPRPGSRNHLHHAHSKRSAHLNRATSADSFGRRDRLAPSLVPPENGVPRSAGGAMGETELPALPWPPVASANNNNNNSSNTNNNNNNSVNGNNNNNSVNNSVNNNATTSFPDRASSAGGSRASKRINVRETNREAIYGPSSTHFQMGVGTTSSYYNHNNNNNMSFTSSVGNLDETRSSKASVTGSMSDVGMIEVTGGLTATPIRPTTDMRTKRSNSKHQQHQQQ